jgi:two-component system LytT family response regulator
MAVDKYIHPRTQHNYSAQLELLKDNMKQLHQPLFQRIAIPTIEGLILLPVNDILFCEANSSYTILHLNKSEKIVSAKTLKEYEEILAPHGFFRVHHSHLVNLNHVQKYVRGDGGYVIMSNQSTIGVSRNKKESFLLRLQQNNKY